jgi:hypothetical protein
MINERIWYIVVGFILGIIYRNMQIKAGETKLLEEANNIHIFDQNEDLIKLWSESDW